MNTPEPRHPPQPDELDAEFALCLQRYQDQQRRQEISVDALREHLRQTLALGTPEQAQLAALDAVLAQRLGGREQRLLNQVPSFLRVRFKALRQAAAETAADAPIDAPTDAPSKAPTAAGPHWLQGFNAELEQTLLAELEHRLLPVLGLLESLDA